jgi:membrane protein YdbS with pleckstrin-like domain
MARKTSKTMPTLEPSRHLSPSARWLWRLEGLMTGAAALVAVQVLGAELESQPLWTLGAVVVLVVGVGAVPELRWRRFRYEVRDEEIDIRRGAFKVTRTLVPMLRVQHVDTTRGLLEQLFGLSTVVVHTAAGETTIPALDAADADELRDRIAILGRRPDDV